MAILVLYSELMLVDGSFAAGPVTTHDFHEFSFKNTGYGPDFHFSVKKSEAGWSFSDGTPVPQSYIEQLGQQIDQELVVRI